MRNCELEWHGIVPVTPDAIAFYPADYTLSLSTNTLREHITGLANWLEDQGFTNLTKVLIVAQVLKGSVPPMPLPKSRQSPCLYRNSNASVTGRSIQLTILGLLCLGRRTPTYLFLDRLQWALS